MDGYSEADGYGNSKIWRQMRKKIATELKRRFFLFFCMHGRKVLTSITKGIARQTGAYEIEK